MRSVAAVGFRVKSGWATAVLVSADAVVERSVVTLADPKVRGSEQPYHEVLGVHEHAAAKTVARLTAAVERFAAASLDALFARHRDAGHRIGGTGIVVGSMIDPATIANDHIRTHAEEGRLFRSVVRGRPATKRRRSQRCCSSPLDELSTQHSALGTHDCRGPPHRWAEFSVPSAEFKSTQLATLPVP